MWRDYLKRKRLRILMYHAVDSSNGDRLTVTPEKFAEQIFETGHRLRQNRVNGPVFDVLWDETRRRNDCQQ